MGVAAFRVALVQGMGDENPCVGVSPQVEVRLELGA